MIPTTVEWSPRDEIANVLDCEIVESQSELHLHNYVHFRANTLGKGRDLFIPPNYWSNHATTDTGIK